MSDFEIAGLNSLKQALTLMSRQPKSMGRGDPIAEKLINEIYVEIRQARISGYSWKELSAVINEKCKIKIRQEVVSSIFRELDLKYEEETDVKALPVSKHCGGRKKTKPTKTESKDLDGGPACAYTGKKRGRPRKEEGAK